MKSQKKPIANVAKKVAENALRRDAIPYIYSVKAGDRMILGAKKDDKSTSSMVLRVSGMYAP